MEKFPDHNDAAFLGNGNGHSIASARTPSPLRGANGNLGPPNSSDRWLPITRPDSQSKGLGWSAGARGHGRQKSLSEAFHHIRNRSGSVSQNAHEIADALRAPVSPKLVVRDPPLVSASPLDTVILISGD